MTPTETEAYDIIGDVHGHADPLIALLHKMGYSEQAGVFRHPRRKAIFVGDFIDRGPKIREVLRIVRSMTDAGAALAVMGNHELNALRYHSTWPNGKPMRAHSEKNTKQHAATVEQLVKPFPDEWRDWLSWFRSLPLYIDLGGVRVVHAAWCHGAVSIVGPRRFDDLEFFREASMDGSASNEAVRTLLNGPEIPLPDGHVFTDKEGHVHEDIRARWFGCGYRRGVTYREAVFPESDSIPQLEIPSTLLDGLNVYPESEKPVFFGHYWLPSAKPTPLARNAASIDYSVASKRGGNLVAYRWDGECELHPSKFVWVSSKAKGIPH